MKLEQASEGFWHKQHVNVMLYKAFYVTWAVYYIYHKNFHWNISFNLTDITKSKSQIELNANVIAI